jgi:hypothetical protein
MSQVQPRLMPELKKGESQKKRTVLRLGGVHLHESQSVNACAGDSEGLDLNFGACLH